MDVGQVANALKDANGQQFHVALDWAQFGALISAVGALGLAAFGVVEALGKALTFSYTERDKRPADLNRAETREPRSRPPRVIRIGLGYAGFSVVTRMAKPLGPALECAYGSNYLEIIAQQYRAARSTGRAPDMIREGVKLGLPFLRTEAAASVIDHTWLMEPDRARALALALSADPGRLADAPTVAALGPPGVEGDTKEAQLLAGRFATALNERVTAAFLLAEEQYEAYAKMWAGAASVTLAMLFNMSIQPHFHWWVAAMIGVVAVPLAPVAKDLSSSLQNALTAFKSIPTRRA